MNGVKLKYAGIHLLKGRSKSWEMRLHGSDLAGSHGRWKDWAWGRHYRNKNDQNLKWLGQMLGEKLSDDSCFRSDWKEYGQICVGAGFWEKNWVLFLT